MIFNLENTSVYFKQFFGPEYFENKDFIKLCKYLKEFPLKEEYPHLPDGLYLSGDRYFRNILFSDADGLLQEEIEQITDITPIMEDGLMPYTLERNFFEITIPVGKKGFSELKDSISMVDKYFINFFGADLEKKIEVHLKGAGGKLQTETLIEEIIPGFPKADYSFQVIIKDEIFEGSVSLPIDAFKLPDEITQLIGRYNNRHSLMLENGATKFVLKSVNAQELEMSLYSSNVLEFMALLGIFDQRDRFIVAFPTEPSHELPLVGAY